MTQKELQDIYDRLCDDFEKANNDPDSPYAAVSAGWFLDQLYRQYKDGEISAKEVADYLLRTYPVTEIALALAETLDFDIKPIAISQQEFDLHFRIKGVRADGTPENRGKKHTRKDRDF